MADLQEFYGVTLSGSVYRAKIGGDGEVPALVKIAEKKDVQKSISIGDQIDNGSMIAIAQSLLLFTPEKYGPAYQLTGVEREVTAVNTFYWGGRTSQIVALFLKKINALECVEMEGLQFCDPRFKEQTIRVLKAVGNDHPYCSISTAHDFWLMPLSEWQ